jgi:hypothetical protein
MSNEQVSGMIPEELKEPSSLKLFNEVVRQHRKRGWALLFPADLDEMGTLNRLAQCGLIVIESDGQRFDLSGRAKSAEVICQLTHIGSFAARITQPTE